MSKCSSNVLLLLGVTAIVCTFGSVCGAEKKSLNDSTGPWQLFVDDYLIAEKANVVRTYHAFQKYEGNPVMYATEPWEANVAYGCKVLPQEDGSGYRMWYLTCGGGEDGYRDLYAVSEDGIIWEKPKLGIVEWKGSKENNIYIDMPLDSACGGVIYTPWDSPERQYKMMCFDYGRTPPKHAVSGYWGVYSADGIHWTDYPDNPVLRDSGDVGRFDWDSRKKKYTGYPKKFAPVRGYRRRCVGYSETEDFGRWHPGELILVPDEFDDRWVEGGNQHTDFYGLDGFAYESMYIGFLWIYRITDGKDDGPIFVEFVSSRDGINWRREEIESGRPAILDTGPSGSWDAGMVLSGGVLVEGDTLKMWYSGMNVTHDGEASERSFSGGLATLRKDGFASLDAGQQAGEVTTKRLKNLNGKLYVNAEAKGGWVKVEVLNAKGDIIKGYGRNECEAIYFCTPRGRLAANA